MTTRYRVVRSTRESSAAIADGSPGVILILSGWMGSPEQRQPVLQQIRRSRQVPPAHGRWIWLRETEDGQAETAFLIWPCTTVHRPGFQCRNSQAIHGNSLLPGGIPLPALSK